MVASILRIQRHKDRAVVGRVAAHVPRFFCRRPPSRQPNNETCVANQKFFPSTSCPRFHIFQEKLFGGGGRWSSLRDFSSSSNPPSINTTIPAATRTSHVGSDTPTSSSSFLDHWSQARDHLVTRPVGTWGNRDWNESCQLLHQVKSHFRVLVLNNSLEVSALEECFSLMDRQCKEITLHKEHSGALELPTRLPLDDLTLAAVLVAWRDWISSTLTKQTNETTGKDPQTLTPAKVWERLELYQQHGLFDPEVPIYNILLHATSKALIAAADGGGEDAAVDEHIQTAEHILKYMFQRSQRNPENVAHHPDAETISHIVDLYVQQQHQQQHRRAKSLSSSSSIAAWERAERHLRNLQTWYEEQGRVPVYQPPSQLYCSVMEAHSRGNEPKAATQRIVQLFDELRRQPSYDKDNRNDDDKERTNRVTDLIACNRACHALAAVRHPEHLHIRAVRTIFDEMMETMEEQSDENSQQRMVASDAGGGDNDVADGDTTMEMAALPAPNRITFLAVMTAYARAGTPEEAQHVFDTMEQWAGRLNNNELRPCPRTYSALIWAYAKSGNTTKAHQILQRMLADLEQHGEDDVANSSQVWGGILTSWAESKDPAATRHMWAVLQQLYEKDREQAPRGRHHREVGQRPPRTNRVVDVALCNILLSCYARIQGASEAKKGARDAERLLEWMQHQPDPKLYPNGDSYLNVILAWSNARVPEQCEHYLRKLYESTVQSRLPTSALTTQHFNAVMEAWRNSYVPSAFPRSQAVFDRMKQLHVPPDVNTYNSLLLAAKLLRDGQDTAPVMMNLYEEMVYHWKQGGSARLAPNDITYNAVLSGLSYSSDPAAANMAETVFQAVADTGPRRNTELYSSLMTVYSCHNQPNRVEELFQELQQLYKESGKREDLKPNEVAHRARLQAWSKQGCPHEATAALQDFLHDAPSLQMREKTVAPNERDFTAVISAWAMSGLPEAWKKAERGLEQMKELSSQGKYDCVPTNITYAAVIAAFGKAEGPSLPNPGEKASQLLEELKQIARKHPKNKSLQPNIVTYNSVMVAWIQQNESEPVEKLFEEAKERFGVGGMDPSLHRARLRAWSSSGNPEKAREALEEWLLDSAVGQEPHPGDYHSFLLSWVHSDLSRTGEKAEAAFRDFAEMAQTKGRQYRHGKPCGLFYSLVLSAYAQSSAEGSGERALRLLEEFKELDSSDQPGLKDYASVIESLLLSHHIHGQSITWRLLKELQTKPNSFWQGDATNVTRRLKSTMHRIADSGWPEKQELFEGFAALKEKVETPGFSEQTDAGI